MGNPVKDGGTIEGGQEVSVRSPSRDGSFSDQIHGVGKFLQIDWSAFFPFALYPNISVDVCTSIEGLAFVKEYYPKIFGNCFQDQRFLMEEMTDEKFNYYQLADFFIFKDGSRPIGIFIGHAFDWSSYYIRSNGVLPEFQGLGLYQRFLTRFLEALSGTCVHRVEVDIIPANAACVHLYNKFQFKITGLSLSERWGALVRFSRFLSQKSDQIYQRQFCANGSNNQSKGGIYEKEIC